jgi:hypothetical protein
LTVSCSNGTGTGFAWSATAPAGCSGNCTASWGAGAQTSSGSNTLTLPAAGLWNVTVTVTGPSAVTTQASVQANAAVAGGTNLCAAQGFSKTIFYKWDWAGAQPSHLDTVYLADMAGGSGLGTNGILVVEFTPNGPADFNNVSSISATGYPAPNLINTLTMAVSTQPCDLGAPWPASSSSTSPSVAYGVGTVVKPWTGSKTAVELQPGTRYYLNVAGRDQSGANTCVGLPGGWNCDIRLSPQKPPGH